MKKLHVYVASPYSNPDPIKIEANVHRSMLACEQLMVAGFVPFLTLASHYYDVNHYSHTWEEWMEFDIAWLSKCDALLRLEGASKGADREVDYAVKNNIPVFYTIESLKMYAENLK
jgi:nucleoside 2-deoxyribosyltransferase